MPFAIFKVYICVRSYLFYFIFIFICVLHIYYFCTEIVLDLDKKSLLFLYVLDIRSTLASIVSSLFFCSHYLGDHYNHWAPPIHLRWPVPGVTDDLFLQILSWICSVANYCVFLFWIHKSLSIVPWWVNCWHYIFFT